MKIALVTSYPTAGFLPEALRRPKHAREEHATPWVRALCQGFAARDEAEVTVWVYSRTARQRVEVVRDRIRYVFVPKHEPLRTTPYHFHVPQQLLMIPQLRRSRPDVVVGFGTEGGHALTAIRSGLVSILFIQGILEKLLPFCAFGRWPVRIMQRLEHWSVRAADGVVAENGFAAAWAAAYRDAASIRVIPHGYNDEFLGVRREAGPPRALFIGTLNNIKAPDVLIRAFAACQPARDWQLVLVGDGPIKDECVALIHQLGVDRQVAMTGHLDRAGVLQQMARATFLVLPSRMDTAPNVITEAHAAGLPVIASATGGLPEMVADGSDGCLVSVDDVAGLSARLKDLFAHPEACARLGQAGRQKIRRLNDPVRVAAEHVRFYREIIARRRTEPGAASTSEQEQ